MLVNRKKSQQNDQATVVTQGEFYVEEHNKNIPS